MQYDVETPEDYFAVLEDDWRKEKLLAVRDLILGASPDVEETIGYGMLRYGWEEDCVIGHLNAQKGYVAVYLGDLERLDPGGKLRAGMNCGKSCVRIRKRDSLDSVAALIARKSEMIEKDTQ